MKTSTPLRPARTLTKPQAGPGNRLAGHTAARKPWAVRIEVRTPHKLDQPLGSDSCGGEGSSL